MEKPEGNDLERYEQETLRSIDAQLQKGLTEIDALTKQKDIKRLTELLVELKSQKDSIEKRPIADRFKRDLLKMIDEQITNTEKKLEELTE